MNPSRLTVNGEVHELSWKAGYRFPRFRRRSGETFSGVQATLEKPHGYRSIMETVIADLTARSSRRYKSLVQRLTSRYPSEDVEQALRILLTSGILVLSETNRRPARGNYFDPVEISLDPRARDEAQAIFRPQQAADVMDALRRDLEKVSEQWRPCNTPVAKRLEHLVQQAIEQDPAFPIPPTAHVRYRAVAAACAHARRLLGEGGMIPLRTLSTMIFQDSKVLERYKRDLVHSTGYPLKDLGLITNPSLVYVYGGVRFRTSSGFERSLSAECPSVLTEDAVLTGDFLPDSVRVILIVENLAVFTALTSRAYSQRNDVLVLFGEGFPGRAHLHLLSRILSRQALPIVIWPDLDGAGMAIYAAYASFAKCHGAHSVSPLLMDEDAWRLVEHMAGPADAYDLRMAQHPGFSAQFPYLCARILNDNKIIEQESFLEYYAHIKHLLP